jgi:cation:H+ antiporter
MTSLVQNLALFLLGLFILVIGAESLIRGAVRVARALGISPFVIGMTIVGFGTSAPELVVNISAALRGAPGLAVGNIVGANVANIGLILGIAALIRPLTAHMRLLKIEIPIVIVASLALILMSLDNQISRLDGLLLLIGFVAMAIYLFHSAKQETVEVQEEVSHLAEGQRGPRWLAVVQIVLGIIGLLAGAQLLVDAASEIARGFGVSELMIGLTIVAVGTTSPELASTISAAGRGEADIAVGNVVGSCLFNILLILGATSSVRPLRLEDESVVVVMVIMSLFAAALIPILLTGLRVTRWEGGLLLLAYGVFLGWQIATALG